MKLFEIKKPSASNKTIDFILGISQKTTNKMLSNEFEILSLYNKLSKENKIRLLERAETLLDLQKNSHNTWKKLTIWYNKDNNTNYQ